MKRITIVCGLLVLLILVGVYMTRKTTEPTPTMTNTAAETVASVSTSPRTLPRPAMELDQNKKYTAILTTSAGDITIELADDATPITVNNFVYLARNDYYDNTIFHRVIKDFMIQGGDPTGTGRGGPGYRFDDEAFGGSYVRGTVAMANAGPDTNGSQFFIVHQEYPLPLRYVIFGRVIAGFEALDLIATALVEPSAGGELSQPVRPAVIRDVIIVEE